jgi:hypothetical protein
MVGWTIYRQDAVKVTKGTPKVYVSSKHGPGDISAPIARPTDGLYGAFAALAADAGPLGSRRRSPRRLSMGGSRRG